MASFPRGAVLRYTCHRSRGTQGARSHPAHLTYRRCYIPCRLPQPGHRPQNVLADEFGWGHFEHFETETPKFGRPDV